MPNTKVFSGYSSLRINQKDIVIQGSGDSADITLTYVKQHVIYGRPAKIKVYALSELKESKTFIEATDVVETETLVNQWFTKTTPYSIIKYATDNQLAFVFSSDSDVNEILQTLMEFTSLFIGVDYFKESGFCKELNRKLQIDVQTLKTTHGLDDARIKFFLNHSYDFFALLEIGFSVAQLGAMELGRVTTLLSNHSNISTLLKLGITIKQLEIIELSKLQQYFSHPYDLDKVLKFITIQHLFGLDSTPLKLNPPVIHKIKNNIISGQFGSGSVSDSFGKFSQEDTDNSIKIKYKDYATQHESHFNLTFGNIAKSSLKEIESEIKDIPAIELVHNWYVVSEKTDEAKNNIKTIYSPELQYVVTETCGDQFPKTKSQKYYLLLISAMYYKELQFIEFLQEHGYSIRDYKKLTGMSLTKLELICDNFIRVKDLIGTSIKVEDLARCDETRLRHFMTNYYEAKDALKYVSLAALLDLKPASRRASLGLFDSNNIVGEKIELPEQAKDLDKCLIM